MKNLDQNIKRNLQFDAKDIKDFKAKIKEIKGTYLREVAAEKMLPIANEYKKKRDNNRTIINNLLDNEFDRIEKMQNNKYISETHQLGISNTLKLLEMNNYNVDISLFKRLVDPLVVAKDYTTLEMLSNVLSSKENIELYAYCESISGKKDIEDEKAMLETIREYINTDFKDAVAGNPGEFKNSTYEEVYIKAETLGFDVTGMDKEYFGGNSILDMDGYIDNLLNNNNAEYRDAVDVNYFKPKDSNPEVIIGEE